MANTLLMAGAHSNGLAIAAADRVGTERGQPFLGCSIIVGSAGWPLAGPASPDQEEILLASVDLSAAVRRQELNRHNHLLDDRRPEAYSAALAPDRAPPLPGSLRMRGKRDGRTSKHPAG